jgi:hypothetical protein
MGIRVENILTDNGKEFTSHWGSSKHIFEKYLALNSIKHRYTKIRHPFHKRICGKVSVYT